MLVQTFAIFFLFPLCFSMPLRSLKEIVCTAICREGQYCNEDDCLLCSNGTFMNEQNHKKTKCKQWTKKPDNFAVILKNGTDKSDIVWGCADGYEKYEFSAGGAWECIRYSTTTTTTTSQRPLSSSSTSTSDTITYKTANPHNSQESEKINISAIVISVVVVVVCIIVILISIYCWRRGHSEKTKSRKNFRTEQELENLCDRGSDYKTNTDLEKLYNRLIEVIGIDKCSELLLILPNPINVQILKQEECIDCFKKWEKNSHEARSNLNHAKAIVEALDKLGYKLPDCNLTDPVLVINSLNKADQLNSEFRKFFLVLCNKLGEDSIRLIIFLNLKDDLDLRLSSSTFQKAFSDCLAKWSFNQSYNTTEMLPLTIIEKKLRKLKRQDIIKKWSDLTKNVNQVYTSFNNYHNGANKL